MPSAAMRSDDNDEDRATPLSDPPADGNDDDEEEYEEIEVEEYEEIEEEVEVDEEGEEEVEEEEEEEVEEELAEEEEEVEEEIEEVEEEEVEEEVEEEEEEEVEEEIEEIEEEEEEKDDDDEEEEEEEEDNSDTPKDANGNLNDVSQVMEFEENDRQLESHSTPEKPELRLPSNSLIEDSLYNSKYVGPSKEPLVMEDELHMNCEDFKCITSGEHLISPGKNGSQDSIVKKDAEAFMLKETSEEGNRPHISTKAHSCNSEVMAAETNSQLTNEASNALPMKLDMKPDDVMDSKEEIMPMEVQSEDDKEKTTSRLLMSEIRTRSLSPSADFKDQNKRPAIICDFFAKGWCIRGTSCRFLHISNKTDNSKEQLEGDTVAANFSKLDQFDKGLGNTMEKPKLPGDPDPVVSSIGNDAAYSCNFSSKRIFELDTEESQILEDKHKSSSKDDPAFSCFKDAGMENPRRNWHTADYGSNVIFPALQNRSLSEHRSYLSGSSVTSRKYHGLNLSSYLSSLDNQTYIRGQSVNGAKFDDSLSSGGISAWTGPSISFSSSLNTSSFGSEKLLGNDRDHRAFRSSFLQQSASSNNWEPSVPFRPSFIVTPLLPSSPQSHYDPLRDSIDLPTAGYKLPFKFSFVSPGAQPAYGNSSVSPGLGPENGDKSTLSFHSKFPINILDKNYTPGIVAGELIVVNENKETMPDDENASSTGHSKDVPNARKIDVAHNSRRQDVGARCKNALNVHREKNEGEINERTDGEPKAMRQFRAALVDFVKELLKPTWREGHLNKDAHNTIVKKAVEKVISTLQPHQVPVTKESIKQYLSFSQPKIAKLVEGYCTKYGKS